MKILFYFYSGPRAYNDDKQNRIGLSLFNSNACPNNDIGFAIDIGRLEGAIDGVGVRYTAVGAAGNIALGPVDVSLQYLAINSLSTSVLIVLQLGGKLGTAEAGLKVWEPDVGLDAGFKANVTAAQLNVGPVNMNMGVGSRVVVLV